jgi:DNA-binding NtrC family response regulator
LADPASTTLSQEDGRVRRPGGPASRPHLYLALECDRPLAPPARYSLADVDAVIIGRGGTRGALRNRDSGVRQLLLKVPDRWMSSTHARLSKVFGRWMIEDAGSKNGTVLNGALEKRAVLSDGDLVELGHTFFLYRDGVPTEDADPADTDASELQAPAPGLGTLLLPFSRAFTALTQVAASPVSIVLTGESGTGKEVIARAIHQLSKRPGAFVAVNCGALPETLVETELFGYKKGAFSGAAEDRPGLIRAADRGTLFLDEIGDLPLPSQAAFLRVLQEKEILPVGATRPLPVDFRLVAATHRTLEHLVARGEFRNDLYARISGFTVELPPLRERREDLGLLIGILLRRHLPEKADAITFTSEAARALFRYPWPLNIRELEKAISTAVVLAGENPVDPSHLPAPVGAALKGPPVTLSTEMEESGPLSEEDARRKEELLALLREHGGNISAVARVMGKARMQIQRWIKRYGIDTTALRR